MQEPFKILIIEDDMLIATDLQEKIERAGHQVTAIARTSQQAVDALLTQLPDAALVDIRLEGSTADGITTVQELLTYHLMPIIYLTGQYEYDVIQRAKLTRPAAYLLKPYNVRELLIQIELACTNYKKESRKPELPNVYLPSSKGYEQLNRKDVLYMEAAGAYVKVFLINETQPKLYSMNLGHIAQYFLSGDFYRPSRSLMINLSYLERLEGNQLWMRGLKHSLSIPEIKRADLLKKLTVIKTP
jgi:DNA-binding LytR/AlgR family response regulator